MLYQIFILFIPSCLSGDIFNILLPTHSPALSSVYEDDGVENYENYQAMNAIDGNVDTAAHTDLESVNWFQVELNGFYSASMVTVINRVHHTYYRLVAEMKKYSNDISFTKSY